MLTFWIKESFKLIGRAKSSFFFSLISTTISVLLIAASIISLQLSSEFQNTIKRSVKINVFLQDTLTLHETAALQKDLQNEPYLNSIRYIDKKQAADDFVRETGEDFRKLLDYNPLPASFLITLKENFVDKKSLDGITASISKMSGVDDVVFQQGFVYKLLAYLSNAQKYIFIITGVLFLISLYIVYSTIKLIINSKYEELETMKLVGAKLSTIKMPIVFNGVLLGLFADIIAVAVIFIIYNYVGGMVNISRIFNIYNHLFIGGIILIGPVIGFFVSVFSLRKITLKV